jgi:hypothetical protein
MENNNTEANPDEQSSAEIKAPSAQNPDEKLFLKALGVQIIKEEGDPSAGIDESKIDEIDNSNPGAETASEAPAPEVDTTPRPKLRRKTAPATLDAARVERIKAASLPEPIPFKENPTTPTTATEDPDQDLEPADRSVVALARATEPELAAKHREWIKQRNEFVREATADGGEFDVNSTEWRTFIRHNPPPINSAKREELRDKKVALDTELRLEAKFRSQLQSIKNESERKFRELELRPSIAKEAKEALASIFTPDKEGDEVIRAMSENLEEAQKNYPLEVPVVRQIAADTELVIGEYLQIANGVKDFDEKNIAHNWVATFVEKKGREVDELPVERRMRGGKVLVSRETYIRMMDAKHPDFDQVATLTKEDIINLIAHEAKNRTREQLKSTNKWMQDRGLVRAPREKIANEISSPPIPAARQAPKAMLNRVPSPPSKPATNKKPSYLKALGVNK